MVDRISKQRRSWNMSRIKGKNTAPEIILRKLLHRAGYRFRLHATDLPGKPDIIFRKYKTVIFVNGCFWHRHEGCSYATTPKSNSEFWLKKFRVTKERDKRNRSELERLGWRVIIIWECELNSNPNAVLQTVKWHFIQAS